MVLLVAPLSASNSGARRRVNTAPAASEASAVVTRPSAPVFFVARSDQFGSFSSGVRRFLQEPFQELLAGTEVCPSQAIERRREMCKAVLRCVHQNAERSQHPDTESLGLLAGGSLIYQQRVS